MIMRVREEAAGGALPPALDAELIEIRRQWHRS